jgi:hypothetical protein
MDAEQPATTEALVHSGYYTEAPLSPYITCYIFLQFFPSRAGMRKAGPKAMEKKYNLPRRGT